jgi:hypothetical protein
MGAKRVMYWRQAGDEKTMQNFMELSAALQAGPAMAPTRFTATASQSLPPCSHPSF